MSTKLLLDPIYTIGDVNKCITYFALDATARYMLDHYEDSYVYVIKPSGEGSPFVLDEKLGRDYPGRVKYIDGYYSKDRFYEFTYQPDWFYDIVSGTGFVWDWDILISTRGPGMHRVRWMNNHGWDVCKKIIVYEPFPVVKVKKAAWVRLSNRPELEVEVLTSYLNTDAVVLNTKFEVQGIMDSARTWLSASACKNLKSRLFSLFTIPKGLDIEYGLKKEVKTNPETLFGIFTQRMDATERQPDKVLDSFFYSFAMDSLGKVVFRITTNSALGWPETWQKKYNFVSFHTPRREQFYEFLKESHFCISMSIDEGMPTSLLEATCFGVIPVVLRRNWSEEMFGKDYPWLVKNVEEAVVLIKRIKTDYAKEYAKFKVWYASHWLPYLREFGQYEACIDKLVLSNREEINAMAAKRAVRKLEKEDDDMETVIVKYVKRKGLKRFKLFDLYCEMFDKKLIRINPRDALVGSRTQFQVHFPDSLEIYLPRYYSVLKSLIYKTGWKQGLEVGEVIVTDSKVNYKKIAGNK